MREIHMELFGEDVLGRTDKDWGLDEEGEINGSYRPCGFPGVSHGSPLIYTTGLANRVRLTALVRHRRLLYLAHPFEAVGKRSAVSLPGMCSALTRLPGATNQSDRARTYAQ